MSGGELGFIHRFIPGSLTGPSVTLLLLHGTGGNESDLIPLGEELLPDAALLSPRGKVLENGMPRFFRRLSEGVFDLEDLKLRTEELTRFITEATKKYGLEDHKTIAVGYSNGANIAASILLTHPAVLAAAVLFRAMIPFVPQQSPDLQGKPILLAGGRRDPIIPPQQTAALAGIFEKAGARVSIHEHNGGHELGAGDIAAAKNWLSKLPPD
jgi:predicted esterase